MTANLFAPRGRAVLRVGLLGHTHRPMGTGDALEVAVHVPG